MIKTRQEIKEQFFQRGLTVRDWAREHGVSEYTVYDILLGRKKGIRGESHKVAVLLGLKHGVLEK